MNSKSGASDGSLPRRLCAQAQRVRQACRTAVCRGRRSGARRLRGLRLAGCLNLPIEKAGSGLCATATCANSALARKALLLRFPPRAAARKRLGPFQAARALKLPRARFGHPVLRAPCARARPRHPGARGYPRARCGVRGRGSPPPSARHHNRRRPTKSSDTDTTDERPLRSHARIAGSASRSMLCAVVSSGARSRRALPRGAPSCCGAPLCALSGALHRLQRRRAVASGRRQPGRRAGPRRRARRRSGGRERRAARRAGQRAALRDGQARHRRPSERVRGGRAGQAACAGGAGALRGVAATTLGPWAPRRAAAERAARAPQGKEELDALEQASADRSALEFGAAMVRASTPCAQVPRLCRRAALRSCGAHAPRRRRTSMPWRTSSLPGCARTRKRRWCVAPLPQASPSRATAVAGQREIRNARAPAARRHA